MAKKRTHSPDESETTLGPKETKHFKSSPIEDRSSTFVGLFSPTTPAKELQKLPEFKTASHRMLAWRKPSAQRTLTVGHGPVGKSTYITGSDDDDEKYGGKRLEKVLNELDVEGAVVVARWYGGVLLGPVRFTHIENAAREAILLWKTSLAADAKKRKTEEAPADGAEQRKQLIHDLQERDNSISVLRQLLAEKSQSQNQSQTQSQGPLDVADSAVDTKSAPTPHKSTKGPDYTTMPFQRLKQLDKARDATIAWILKQIDDTEAKTRDPKLNQFSRPDG